MDAEVLPVEGAIVQIERAQQESALAIAKQYPRGTGWINKAVALCCYSPEIAEQQFYVLKRKERDGSVKLIEGPSIRIAEGIAATYGNLRYASRVLDIGDKTVTAQGVATDLETNTSVSVEVSRRITTRDGVRFGDDMITVTANAACSIALRNALLRIIPRSYVQQIMEKAKESAVGKAVPIEVTRQKAAEAAGKMGVSVERMCAAVGKESIDQLDRDALLAIKGLLQACRDGESSVEDSFPHVIPAGEAPTNTAEAVKEAAKRRAGRPPGSKNKPKEPGPAPEPQDNTLGDVQDLWTKIDGLEESDRERVQQRIADLGDTMPAVIQAWGEYIGGELP